MYNTLLKYNFSIAILFNIKCSYNQSIIINNHYIIIISSIYFFFNKIVIIKINL